MSCISTVVQDHIGLPVLGRDASIDTPPEILFRFATPGENREPCVPTKTEKQKKTRAQLEPNPPPPSFRRSQTEITSFGQRCGHLVLGVHPKTESSILLSVIHLDVSFFF
jgi:hypothetical protein